MTSKNTTIHAINKHHLRPLKEGEIIVYKYGGFHIVKKDSDTIKHKRKKK